MNMIISCQPGNSRTGEIVSTFEKRYNDQQFVSIFHLFSPEMKKALPPDQTTQFFTGLYRDAGKIMKREYLRKENSYTVYKTTFERGIFSLNISLDKDSMINGLFIKPYTETTLPKMERNKTALQLPFREEWTVFWGGDTKELNYHIDHPAQKKCF